MTVSIAALRHKMGCTVETFAGLLAHPVATVIAWESGAAVVPSSARALCLLLWEALDYSGAQEVTRRVLLAARGMTPEVRLAAVYRVAVLLSDPARMTPDQQLDDDESRSSYRPDRNTERQGVTKDARGRTLSAWESQ